MKQNEQILSSLWDIGILKQGPLVQVNQYWVPPSGWKTAEVRDALFWVEKVLNSGVVNVKQTLDMISQIRQALLQREKDLQESLTNQLDLKVHLQGQSGFDAISKLREENLQLRVELARMTERCTQTQLLQQSLSQENVRLRGELSDLMNKLILVASQAHHNTLNGSVLGQASFVENSESSIETRSWQLVGRTIATNSLDSVESGSADSFISVGTQGHCFVSDAIFKTMSGQSVFFLPAVALRKGSRVMADDGCTMLEVVAEPEPYKTDTIIELYTESATLSVTKDHRIPIVSQDNGEQREARAAELKAGVFVFVDGHKAELKGVQEKVLEDEIDVIKIAFKPDLPVGVFSPPATISSQGSKKKAVRRGQHKPGQKYVVQEGACASIPDTAGAYTD